MSECAAKYAVAIADPMNPAALGACVPTGNSRPSFKVRTVQRGSFAVGTAGTGFLLLTPTLGNNNYLAFYTTNDYGSGADNNYIFSTTSGAVTGLGAGVAALVNATAPYPAQNFYAANAEAGSSTNVVGRVVSFGASIQYAGSVMDMGGTMTSLSRATHQSALLGGGTSVPTLGVSNVQSYVESRMARVSDQKIWLLDSARLDGEENYSGNTMFQQDAAESFDYANVLYPFSQGTLMDVTRAGSVPALAQTGVVSNLFVVTGAKAGAIFNFEIVHHYEFQGLGAQYALTPSHQDAVGFGTVREAAAALPALSVEYPLASSPSLMSHALSMATEHLAPKAMAAGGAMLRSALTGGGLAASLGAGAAMLI